MSINKKKQNKIKKKNINKQNIIFILVFIIILVIIIFLSLNIKAKDEDSVYSFSSSEFEYVTTIGLSEYEASLYYEGTSIIFFCSNEDEDCYSELVALNSIASSNDLSIEYINVLELVDLEKEELIEISDIFENAYYPNLVIIQDGDIVSYYDDYLNEEDIEMIFTDYEII